MELAVKRADEVRDHASARDIRVGDSLNWRKGAGAPRESTRGKLQILDAHFVKGGGASCVTESSA
jgi:hypothetical protein